jgi:PAS domain S-box-containing protein
MLSLRHPSPKDLSARSFFIAMGIMAAALLVRAALDMVLPDIPPLITIYPAVALGGLLCGPWAGGVAGVMGVLGAALLWMPPRLTLAVHGVSDQVSIGLFILSSAIVLLAAAELRAQLDAAGVARSAVELGLEAGGVGTWEFNLRTRRISASSAARRLHGVPESKRRTTVEDWLRGIHDEDVEAARAALRAAVSDGSLAAYSYRIFGVRDGPRWIAARGRVVSRGGERRLLCALVDVSEQMRVQDELRRERERLRLALAAGSLAVWDYDSGSQEVTVDARYAATLGFAPRAATLTLAQIGARIHPEDQQRVAAEHAAMVARGDDYRIEYRVVTDEGDVRWVISQGIRIDGGELGDRGRMVGIIQDISERKRREGELHALAAVRELLVREADHRIKNSLQLVVSLLSDQQRGLTDPAAVAALRGAIARVGAIAASHLALQGSEDLRQVDLAVSLRELCRHLGQLQPGIGIVCRAGEGLMLDADRAIPLGLAVSEVVTNALRHAFSDRSSGTVIVEAVAERGVLVVRVSDDGVGIAATAESGLGSSLIRSLAAGLGAAMQVQSTPGAGTVVTLRLPLDVSAEAVTA